MIEIGKKIVPNFSKVDQIGPNRFKLGQIGLKWFKLVQIGRLFPHCISLIRMDTMDTIVRMDTMDTMDRMDTKETMNTMDKIDQGGLRRGSILFFRRVTKD